MKSLLKKGDLYPTYALHNGISSNVNSEDGGEMPQAVSCPLFANGDIFACEGGHIRIECSANALAKAMVNFFFSFFDIFASWQPHGSPPFKLANGEPSK
jgi:hypothetical protein